MEFIAAEEEVALDLPGIIPNERLPERLRTADIWSEGTKKVGTKDMGDAVVAALNR